MSYQQGSSTGTVTGTSTDFGSVGSFGLWFKPLTDLTTGGYLIPWATTGGVFCSATFYTDLNWYLGWVNSTDYRAIGASTPSTNAWHYLLTTWDDSTNQTQGFLDGVLIAVNTSALVTAATGSLYLGNDAAANGRHDAAIRFGEGALYTRVVNSTEAAQLASGVAASSIPSGLVHYWPMTTGDLTDHIGSDTLTAVDASPNADHPTITTVPSTTSHNSLLLLGVG